MIYLLLSLSFKSTQSYSAPICFLRRDVIAGPSDVARYILRVDVIGNPDRKNAKDFARDNGSTVDEVTKRYAASGDLQCGTKVSQAQLVIKNNIVLVANHGLPGSPCIDAKLLNTCKVTFNEGGKPKEYGLKRLIKGGKTCKPGFLNMNSEDWAVLELKDAVGPSIEPYEIRSAPCASKSNPVDVVAVGKSVDFGAQPRRGWAHWTKHYGNCQVQKGDCGQRFPLLLSDCDTSGGSSGGGMFVGGANPELIGIVSASGKACDLPHPEKFGPYDELCWHSAYAPVSGELKTLLDSFKGTNATPDAEAPGHKVPPASRQIEFQQDL